MAQKDPRPVRAVPVSNSDDDVIDAEILDDEIVDAEILDAEVFEDEIITAEVLDAEPVVEAVLEAPAPVEPLAPSAVFDIGSLIAATPVSEPTTDDGIFSLDPDAAKPIAATHATQQIGELISLDLDASAPGEPFPEPIILTCPATSHRPAIKITLLRVGQPSPLV